MILGRAFTASLCLTLALSPVVTPLQAAVLQNVTGNVVVNKGQGFEPARNNTEVLPGDQVVIGPGAGAVLNYSAGCSVPVPMETVVTVSAQAPCTAGKSGAPGETAATNGASQGTQAAGETVTSGQPGTPGEPGATGEPTGETPGGTSDETFGVSNTTLIVGGVVIAAAAIVAVVVNANKSASP